MEDNKDSKSYIPVGPWKSFWTSFLNALSVLVISIASYLVIFKPIKENKYSQTLSLRENSYQTILDVGHESKLLKNNESNTASFNQISYYEFFVGLILKNDYESNIYNKDEDLEGYKDKEEKFIDLPIISIDREQGIINDDYLGYFYTKFVPSRFKKDSSPLLDYNSKEPIKFFFDDILKINDVDQGGYFFDFVSYDEFPHFKTKIRLSLFDYVVNKIAMPEYGAIDKKFYTYFLDIFDDASALLLEDKYYGKAFDNFNSSNETLVNYEIKSNLLSYSISIILLFFVLPLVIRKGRTTSNLITKTLILNEEEKFGGFAYFLRGIQAFLKYFHVLIVLAYMSDAKVISWSITSLGKFSISLSLFMALSLVYCLASIVISLINKENRSLENLLTNTYLVKEVRKSGKNKPSDIG